MGRELSDYVLKTIMNLSSLHRVEIYYKWNLIERDPDDNKFVDCAIASNARFLVSHDKHFKVLKNIAFPKVEVISTNGFKEELKIANS